jgi:hypothetical protein
MTLYNTSSKRTNQQGYVLSIRTISPHCRYRDFAVTRYVLDNADLQPVFTKEVKQR